MARIKNINTRIQLKNDTEINWNKAKAEEGKDGFIPLLGEAIVYMGENGHGPRIKIGDGETNVTELPFLEDNDTVYTADKGIEITAENIIQHINNLDAPPSEIGFYKIKYDQQGHINGATVVNKQDILNLLQMTPGRIDSVQITAEVPLVSSNSTENTTNLVTNISFSQQNQNTVLAGPTQSATGAPSFRQLEASDIPNLDASKITTGTFPESQIGNLSASKITSDTFNEDRIPTLGPNKISGVIPVSKGGTGVDGVNGNLENNITRFFNNGIFAYDSTNARFKQFGITALGNTDTFTDYINSLNGATGNLIVDLNTLIKAIPPINLNNPRDITENYTNSYYAPKTKGYENSVLISQGKENNNEGTEPIWLNPTALSAEGFHGGALFYGRYSREVERIVDNETVTYTDTGFETQWGTLPVEQGGTGVTNFDDNCVLIGSGENPIRTIAKTSLLSQDQNKNTIVERDTNGDFATRIITLSVGTGGLKNNSTETNNQQIISINNSGISTHYGNLMADNLIATIGTIKMSKFNANNVSEQPIIEWYKKESKNDSLVNVKVGELYWDYNKSNRGMLRNYYSTTNGEIYSDSYYLPAVDTSSTNNRIFTLLATDSISNVFPSNSILYSNGEVNKITYKESANGTLYSTSANGSLEWGTLPVAQGGTGFTTTTNVNAIVIGNSTLATGALQTVATTNGAFFATGNNSKPQFGILPVAQGGTGVTSIGDIQAGKDGDGNTISSTYLKLSGGTMTGTITQKYTDIDTYKTNNDVLEDTTKSMILIKDKNNKGIVDLRGQVRPDGKIVSSWLISNYNTSGERVASKGISIYLDKTGELTYNFSNPANARSALAITPTNIGALPATETAVNSEKLGSLSPNAFPRMFRASTSSYEAVVVTHPELNPGNRGRLFAYGDGNGNGWSASIIWGNSSGTHWVRSIATNYNGSHGKVALIDSTHFAIISTSWDKITILTDHNEINNVETATQTYSPSTENHRVAINDQTITASEFIGPLTGNATTATTLKTARSINGTSFDGSAAITTANWGTARNITIKDASSTNAGTAVSVNGSSAITLLLPSTIKASITGNATSATKATQDSDGNTINSTYLKLSGGTLTGDLNLKTSSADSPDIIWWYGNTNKEQARIWMDSGFSSKGAPHFREYNSNGTSLYDGYLPLGDGTGASGTWEIDISGNAATATLSPRLNSSGFQEGCLSYYQADDTFFGSASGWEHFIICNHGNGSTYYNYTIGLPFYGVPQYKRQTGSTSSTAGWHDFLTTEKTVTVAQGGTGVTSIEDIQAGKDGDGNTITSTYLKLSGGTLSGALTVNGNINNYKLHVGESINADDVRTTNGIWICNAAITNAPTANHGALFGIASVGTPCQYFMPDNLAYIYKRWYSSSAWNSWTKISAGYADSAGSVAWGNVSGKPGNYPGGCTGNATTATMATQDGSGNTITSTYLRLDGGTMNGNLSINNNGISYVQVKNTETGVGCFLYCDTKSSGSQHGIYSPGYWNGSSFVGGGKWLIYRNSSGNVTVNGNCTGSAGSVSWANVTNKPTSYQIFGGGSFYESATKQWTNAGDHVWLDSGTLNYTIPAGRYFICASCYVHQNTGSGVVKVRFNQSSSYQLEEIVSDGAIMNSSGTVVVITGCLTLPAVTRAQIILNANGAGYTITGFSFFSNRLTLIPIN